MKLLKVVIFLLFALLIIQYLDLSQGSKYDFANLLFAVLYIPIAIITTTVILVIRLDKYENSKPLFVHVLIIAFLIIVYFINPIRNSIHEPEGNIVLEVRREHGGNCWDRIYLYDTYEYLFKTGCFGADELELGRYEFGNDTIFLTPTRFNVLDKKGTYILSKYYDLRYFINNKRGHGYSSEAVDTSFFIKKNIWN